MEFIVAMRRGKRQVRPNMLEFRLEVLVENAKVDICTKGEHLRSGWSSSVRLFEDQAEGYGYEPLQVDFFAAFANRFQESRQLLATV